MTETAIADGAPKTAAIDVVVAPDRPRGGADRGVGGTAGAAVIRRLDRFGLVVALAVGALIGAAYAFVGSRPVDADMVWRMAHATAYYGTTWGADAASRYVYPPLLVQLVGLLPVGWPAFIIAWQTALFGALWVILREWTLPSLAVMAGALAVFGMGTPVADPLALLLVGNIQPAIVAAIVLGFRHPGAWAFVALTKIAPAVGLVWFLARGEWRRLGIALGVTAAFAAGSFVLQPTAWADFARFAVGNATASAPVEVFPVPFLVRLPIVVGVIVGAASAPTGRGRWSRRPDSPRPPSTLGRGCCSSPRPWCCGAARRCLVLVAPGRSTGPRLSWETATLRADARRHGSIG